MTMLNAAPTAATAPNGASAGAAVPMARTAPAPAKTPAQGDDKPAAEFRLAGSGASTASGATGVMAARGAVTVPLDAFAKQSGPDAAVQTANGVVSVHAVFQLDARTRELTVAIVNEDGQLVRFIPPESVSRMIAAMAAYRGR